MVVLMLVDIYQTIIRIGYDPIMTYPAIH